MERLCEAGAPFGWIVNGYVPTPAAPLSLCASAPWVPARQLADWLGGRLEWEGGAEEASLRTADGRVRLVLRPHARAAMVAGRLTFLSGPVQVMGDELLAPAEIVAAACGASAAWDPDGRVLVVMRRELVGRTFAIDPGHGGADPGGRGRGYVESQINWTVARHLGRLLALAGAGVVWTRRAATGAALEDRLAVLASPGLAAFVSVHHNSAHDPSIGGTETYYYPGSSGSVSSRLLATAVHSQLVAALGTEDRGVACAAFRLLREAPIPGVRCEALFLTHALDVDRLNAQHGPLIEALAIYRGLRSIYARPVRSGGDGPESDGGEGPGAPPPDQFPP